MPRGFMDDFEGKVVGEEVHEGGLGEDIFSADLDGKDAFLPNIRDYCVERSLYCVRSESVSYGAPGGVFSGSELTFRKCCAIIETGILYLSLFFNVFIFEYVVHS